MFTRLSLSGSRKLGSRDNTLFASHIFRENFSDPYQEYFINELVKIVYQLIKLTMTGKSDQTPWSKQILGVYKYGLVWVVIKVKMFTKELGLILMLVFQCSPTRANLHKLDDVCTNFSSDMVRDVVREYFKVVFP